MNALEQIEFLTNYFDTKSITGSIPQFLLDTVILIIITSVLSILYQKFGNTLSNRKKFSNNFMLLSLITMMIISVIRTSLALSLGLVGALSIIRFRSAIKEPEELVYIFLSIALGLSFGAGERELAIIFFAVIAVVIVVKAILAKKFNFLNTKSDQALYLSIKSKTNIDIAKINAVLDQNTHFIDLKRIDESSELTELLFLIKVNSVENIITIKDSIRKLDSNVELYVLNDEGMFN
jgi:uncharacterized membrane protein YhiD involved in acid resistance